MMWWWKILTFIYWLNCQRQAKTLANPKKTEYTVAVGTSVWGVVGVPFFPGEGWWYCLLFIIMIFFLYYMYIYILCVCVCVCVCLCVYFNNGNLNNWFMKLFFILLLLIIVLCCCKKNLKGKKKWFKNN